MRTISQKFLSLAGLVAYAAFSTGITAALHETLAHGGASPTVSLANAAHSASHDHSRDDHSHGKSHNPECPTCYQLVSGTNAALTLSVVLPQFGDDSRPCAFGRIELLPATEALTSIAPRAPPQA